MREILINLATVVVACVIGLMLVEGALALLGYGALYKSGVSRQHDPVLLYRLEPHFAPEIDANGFRNASAEGPFDIVYLGDSHTYGYGVVASQAMPRQIERLTGLKGYAFAMGGYGPAQYAHLSEQALDLQPRFLVVAMFLGNDVTDACAIANILPYWRDYLRARELETELCGGAFRGTATPAHRGLESQFKSMLKSTRLGSLLNQHVFLPLSAWVRFRFEPADGVGMLQVDDAKVRTLVSPWQNDSAGARDGLVIARHFLGEIIAAAQQKDVCPIVLLLPSKQSVMLEYLEDMDYSLPAGLAASVDAERAFEAELLDHARMRGALAVSAFAELREAFDAPGALYPPDADSHPTEKGYLAYARALAPALKSGCAEDR